MSNFESCPDRRAYGSKGNKLPMTPSTGVLTVTADIAVVRGSKRHPQNLPYIHESR